MRQFIEFIPIALFVGVYFTTKDIYTATAILMAGVAVQVAVEYFQDRSVSKRTQVVFWVVMLAGGATVVLQDELFIKWKPTVVNWLFCVALLGSQLIGKSNLLKKMMGEHLPLPDQAWRNLAYGWSLGFFVAGALNLYVAYEYSTDIWVTYKLIGGFAITLSYMIITMTYLYKAGYLAELDNTAIEAKE